MLSPLSTPAFARLFSAQIIALLGTGLLTVALGLLAYDLAGENAGAVLGTAFALKMVAYVVLSPIASALTANLPRKSVLIGADLIRATIALTLPFISEIWQIYLLIFLLQSASATFTPAFQATIPDILPDEDTYTKGLSLSRLAYDLENLISPALAGLLLLVLSFHWLFVGTSLGFLISTALITATALPRRPKTPPRSFQSRLTRGLRIYLATPRLRGLLALNVAAASASAFVLVNTIVITRVIFGGSSADLTVALAAYGAGSMIAALSLPRLLTNIPDRAIMTPAAIALSALMLILSPLIGGATSLTWPLFLITWALMGLLYSAILTPSGRLLRRSAHPEDRAAVFTAQFALSHVGWLVTYPLAGWIGAIFGLPAALALLGVIALTASVISTRLWPRDAPSDIPHSHPDLPNDHPHLRAHAGPGPHHHTIVIDDEHHSWPSHG